MRDKLLNTVPREKSGSTAFNRFSYQNSWALCHLLHLHESGQDYLIAFDYHDDVLVLDSQHNPKKAKFYQIKTKRSGYWTIPQLLRKNSRSKFSYLGKLYHHVLTFPGCVEGLFFISNVPFKIDLIKSELNSTSLSKIQFEDISDKVREKVAATLKNEHLLSSLPEDINLFCFEVTPLSLDDHSSHCLGYVTEFLSRYLNKQNIPAKPFHQTLIDEISRRASCEFNYPDWSDFCEKKTFHRESFQKLLSSIQSRTNFRDIESTMLGRLDNEGIPFHQREEIRKSLTECEIDLINQSNLTILDAKRSIKKILLNIKENNPEKMSSLQDLLNNIAKSHDESINQLRLIKGDAYIKALTLVCLYEN